LRGERQSHLLFRIWTFLEITERSLKNNVHLHIQVPFGKKVLCRQIIS
jgi:hypothetical protein